MPNAFIAIDLKSFYASVECAERGLNPMTTNLVVADISRTEKTICLAVSPSLRAHGIPGRARLFEVTAKVDMLNRERLRSAPGHLFRGKSCDSWELEKDPSLELSYITAVPQMSHYMKISTDIYNLYKKYIAAEDIHVYSIDEVLLDASSYLKAYGLSARELAERMIRDVYTHTGITATAGIGSNLYLAKIAMDIVAKHVEADENGVRIAELDEISYRKLLWTHRPLTDFWRIGKGISKKLEKVGLFTMGDIARCSLGKAGEFYNEDLLYRMFGVNAELLIDHAWGFENCTMKDIKDYRPESSSLGGGQVLMEPYPHEKARIIVREMAVQLALDLLEKKLFTDLCVLDISYDMENLQDPEIMKAYHGPVAEDFYGRLVPKPAHGSKRLSSPSSSEKEISEAFLSLYEEITDPSLLVRRITVNAGNVLPEEAWKKETYVQMDLFTDYGLLEKKRRETEENLKKERKAREAMLLIKQKFGKNAVVKGTDLQDGATGIERNKQIGGHRA